MANAALKIEELFDFDITVKSMQDLSQILINEVANIKSNNISSINLNQAHKLDLIQHVENIKDILKNNPEISKSLSDEQKKFFQKVAQELQDSVTLNNSELMKAKYFNDELIKLIVSSVKNVSTPMRTYTNNGRAAKQSKLKTPASLSFNQEI
jgi:predicted methyltransferase